jgi:hypothetical protein
MKRKIVVTSEEVTNQESGLVPKWTLKHRVSVRSHERVYIRRGWKPMKEEDRKDLIDRGYRVYQDDKDVSFDDARRIRMRGKSGPDAGHWVAVRHIRIESHEKGPEGTSNVPLVRVADSNVSIESLTYELADEVARHPINHVDDLDIAPTRGK